MKAKTFKKRLRKLITEKEIIQRTAQKILKDTGDIWFAVWYKNNRSRQLKEKYQLEINYLTNKH